MPKRPAAPEPLTNLVQLKMSDGQIAHLDGLRKQENDLPSRSEMLRRLVERSPLEADRGRRKS